ncbi:MAG: TonB family protein [Microbacteriaceae bacterium]|nr:TonB family protein [Microbacteriaceae bacterium]
MGAVSSADKLSHGLRWSVILHGILFFVILIKSLVFPSEQEAYIPALRVDLVGLPDLTRQELERIKPPRGMQEEASSPSEKTPPAEKEDMVLHPKKITKPDSRTSQIKNALARIKALSRIQSEDSAPDAPIKGNQISKGYALSGQAKESAQAGYHDLLLEHVRAQWELPVWLARQNLSAQVILTIDNQGRVRNLVFIKPSGHAPFDDAVKRAVYTSQPLPYPPPELRKAMLIDGVKLGFPL